jgi:hypothetical protein
MNSLDWSEQGHSLLGQNSLTVRALSGHERVRLLPIMQTTFHFGFHRDSTGASNRRLALNKETLRQLTDGELRHVAGGGTVISLSPSTRQSGSISLSSGTSVISGNTSLNPSGG